MGVAVTLGLVFVYGAGNLGVYRYYRTEHRREFNPLLHLVCPLVSTVALIWVGYKSIVPLPPSPVTFAPILVGIWLVLGIGVSFTRRRNSQEEWM